MISSAGPGARSRNGPELGDGPHHAFLGTEVRWNVAVSDAETYVWRVVVVYDHDNAGSAGFQRPCPTAESRSTFTARSCSILLQEGSPPRRR